MHMCVYVYVYVYMRLVHEPNVLQVVPTTLGFKKAPAPTMWYEKLSVYTRFHLLVAVTVLSSSALRD